MKANTPHAVFTTEHCIAVGGHFYSFANIQPTFFGLVHAFIMDSLVTNTEHPKTRVLLLRMLQYLYKFIVQGADPKSKLLWITRDAADLLDDRELRLTPPATHGYGHICRHPDLMQLLHSIERLESLNVQFCRFAIWLSSYRHSPFVVSTT